MKPVLLFNDPEEEKLIDKMVTCGQPISAPYRMIFVSKSCQIFANEMTEVLVNRGLC